MNVEDIRDYCLKKNGALESFPFGNETLVFKVEGKIFLLLSLDSESLTFNAKCIPEKAIELREKFSCVVPGYHMNKKHWNTIRCDGTAPSKKIYEWIDDSYNLIVAGLPQTLKSKLGVKKTQNDVR